MHVHAARPLGASSAWPQACIPIAAMPPGRANGPARVFVWSSRTALQGAGRH